MMKAYERWLSKATLDPELIPELKAMDEEAVKDAFYQDLTFGTGGLRAVIGAGVNRMNVYTVARATRGLANDLRAREMSPSVVVGYDTRIKSDLFARVAACVLTQSSIKVYLWPEPLPVPTVSFAIRYLHASAGIMITASHNPSQYNGYKVYGADGGQITTEAAAEILAQIERLDYFDMPIDLDQTVGAIPDAVLEAFLDEVKKQSVLFGDHVERDVSIVYTPLHGTGRKPVLRALKDSGFTNVTVVARQEQPDGHFLTCPYPNPEVREAMALGLECCEQVGADLLLATDPDCDRCGIAVKDKAGYRLLTGNETGLLLLDFICRQRISHGKMPAHPVLIKTIVTTDLAERIAQHYGVRTENVLTGFKFIGEKIGLMEQQGRGNDYIFGFEESYGYLSGSYVRDKDGVNAALLICEMFAYYKTRGIGLAQRLNELYAAYGYSLNTLHSYTFEGAAGADEMARVMRAFRADVQTIGGFDVETRADYSAGLDGLPPSNVLKFGLKGGGSVVVRPSGTEPKLKIYLSVAAPGQDEAEKAERQIQEALEKRFIH